MPYEAPETFVAQKNLPAQPYPFLWLVEGRNPDDGPLVDANGDPVILRITPNTEDVLFGTTTAGLPITWYSYPCEFGELEADLEGSRTTVPLTVSSAFGEIITIWEANDFFRDHVVLLHLVHSLALDDPNAKLTYRMRVADSDFTMSQLTMNLAAGQYTSFDIPQELMDPTCRHTYRGPGCFFIGDPGNATLGACDLTLPACRQRGAYELANNLPVIHPRFFGGIPNPPVGP